MATGGDVTGSVCQCHQPGSPSPRGAAPLQGKALYTVAMADLGAPSLDSSRPGRAGSAREDPADRVGRSLCPHPGGLPSLLVHPWGRMPAGVLPWQWWLSPGRCCSTGRISLALHPRAQPNLARLVPGGACSQPRPSPYQLCFGLGRLHGRLLSPWAGGQLDAQQAGGVKATLLQRQRCSPPRVCFSM